MQCREADPFRFIRMLPWLFMAILVVIVSTGVTTGATRADNCPPEAVFQLERNYFTTDEEITFDASSCYDEEGTTLLYLWDFDDGDTQNTDKPVIRHSYGDPGRYTITLEVTDEGGATDEYSQTINVSQPEPDVAIIEPSDGDAVRLYQPITFRALPHYIVDRLVLYEWDFDGDGVTDMYSPNETVEYTFLELRRELPIRYWLSEGVPISNGSAKIHIDVVTDIVEIEFLTPENNFTVYPNNKVLFSATWHNDTADNLFYIWDFDGDDVIDRITEKNTTSYSYGEEDSGKTLKASVSISDTTEIRFKRGEINITVKDYVQFGETLSDTEVIVVLALFGFIIVVGFLGSWALNRFGIPEVLSLVLLGVILVPIGSLMDPAPLFRISTVFGSLALMIILFDGGLALNLQKVREESSRALLLAGTAFIFTIAAIGAFTGFMFFDGKWSVGVLFGAVIGGTSGSIVLPLISKLKVTESTKTLVSIESTLTDVFCIVVVIAIANYLSPVNGASDTSSGVTMAVSTFIGAFAIGIVTGLILGLIWITLLKRLQSFQYSFMLTIAIVFLLYAFNELFRGSGPISVLIFGLILANGREIGSMLRIKNVSEVSKSMKAFHSQLSFIIRTFFFVFLGIIVSKSLFTWEGKMTWLYGLALLAIIFAARWLAVKVVIRRGDALRDKGLLSNLLPRGLAAAVLALVPVTYRFLDNEILDAEQIRFFFDSAFVVILFTVIYTTIAVPLWQRSMRISDRIESEARIMKEGVRTMVEKVVNEALDADDKERRKGRSGSRSGRELIPSVNGSRGKGTGKKGSRTGGRKQGGKSGKGGKGDGRGRGTEKKRGKGTNAGGPRSGRGGGTEKKRGKEANAGGPRVVGRERGRRAEKERGNKADNAPGKDDGGKKRSGKSPKAHSSEAKDRKDAGRHGIKQGSGNRERKAGSVKVPENAGKAADRQAGKGEKSRKQNVPGSRARETAAHGGAGDLDGVEEWQPPSERRRDEPRRERRSERSWVGEPVGNMVESARRRKEKEEDSAAYSYPWDALNDKKSYMSGEFRNMDGALPLVDDDEDVDILELLTPNL